jgi:hypothetical protein
MPQVLTTNAVIICPHGGVGTTTPATPLWTVNGGPVCEEGDTGVLACPFLLFPCVGYTLRSMGLNALTVAGRKVVLVTDFNQTFTGLPLTMTETHACFDDSTPAPVPPGGSAPPLSSELLDSVAPIVTATPPALAFNTTTMQPATLAASFTLSHPFPMQWVLTLISEPQARNQDVTNGLLPGLTVAPAGGAWDTQSLTVTLNLTAIYMASLGIGLTHFYMTGVSKRGLTNFAEIVLTVS